MSNIARKLASGSFLRVLNLLSQVAVSMVLVPFVVRALGDRMYGFWTLAGTFIGYYGLLDMGLMVAVSRHISGALGRGDEDECNKIVSNALALYSGIALLILAVTGLVALLSPLFVDNTTEAALFWKVIAVLGINLAIEFPTKVFGGVLTARLRYDLMSNMRFLTLVIRTALTVLAINLGCGILTLSLVTAGATIPEKIGYVYFAKREWSGLGFKRNELSRKTVRSLFGYGIFAFASQIADMLRFNLDAFVVSSFVGVSAVTHYGISTSLTVHFITLVTTIMGVLQPVFSAYDAAGENEKIRRVFFFASKISVCIAGFVGFGLIAWGMFFIERWMGQNYRDSYPCLVFLVIGCTVALAQNPSVGLLYAVSKHRFYAIANWVEGILNLFLSLLLVRHYGIVGVALGTCISMLLMKLAIQPLYVCRVASIPYGEYVWKTSKVVLAVLVSLVFPALASWGLGRADYGRLVALACASVAVYSASVWWLVFTREEALRIRDALVPKLFQRRKLAGD